MKEFFLETVWQSLIFGFCFALIMFFFAKGGSSAAPGWQQLASYFVTGFTVNLLFRVVAWILKRKMR